MILTNHKNGVPKSICVTLLFIFVIATPAFAEEIIVKKIILGHFAMKDGNTVLAKSGPCWPAINRHNLSIDDKGHIYVLNLLNREIVIFDDTGKISKKIPLPIKPFKRALDDYGQLEVSADGKRIFVDIPASKGFAYERDFVPSSGLTVNDKGEIIRQTGI